MRTSKPISTISYNSAGFLKLRLSELIKTHKISDFMFIEHHAEIDERKDHIHLWIKPNSLIDTMDLQEFLTEYDPSNPTKPLKCIDFRSSQTDDWILYGMHLKAYLAFKGESREYHYTRDDFVVYDDDTADDLFAHALHGSEFAQKMQVISILNDKSANPAALISSGVMPLQMASQLNAFFRMRDFYGLERGSHQSHEPSEPSVDPPYTD